MENIIQVKLNNKINPLTNVSSSCKADIDYAIKINRWLLKILGIWPLNSTSPYFDIFLTNIIKMLVWLLLTFIFIPGVYLFIIVPSRAVKLRLSGPLSFCVMAIMKYYFLVSGREVIHDCIDHFMEDWRNITQINDRYIMINKAQYGRYGATVCTLFMYGGGVFYAIILPNISGNAKDINNVTTRSFAYPSYYGFFDPQESPAYEIVFSIHCCCAFVMHTIACAPCGIATIFIMHACGQLEVLISWINDLVNETIHYKNNNNNGDKFSKIIQHHVRTLSFIEKIDKILCNICLVEVVGSAFNICSIGYDLMLQWGESDAIGIMTYSILLTSFTLNIFVFCYIGELLTEECSKVGEMSYMIDWHTIPRGRALCLILTILTGQNPVILTAGKFLNLSLNSFSAIMRSAVAYLNLLRTFME